MTEPELIERLAHYEHESWSRWMRYLFAAAAPNADGSVTLPAHLVERWRRQIETAYADLTEAEKESDRQEVAHILPEIRAYLRNTT